MLAADFPEWYVRIVALVVGALFGSFFNVAIYRWPREMSVISPPSHCPSCGAPVKPWWNVPIFGYLFLRGKARCCGAPLSPRYLVVEILGAVLGLAVAEHFFVNALPDREALLAALDVSLYFAFVGGLVIATFVDLEWMEIPDEVSLPLVALGLASSPYRTGPEVVDLAVGAGVGFLLVQVVFVWSYEHLFGRRGMGEGDSKLLMAIGAFLGWQAVLFALVAGSMQGLVATGVAMATGRSLTPTPPELGEDDRQGDEPEDAELEEDDDAPRMKLPFGPFLALGALEWLFFGDRILDAYLGILAP
ncbi:MAG: prepilin peptidase [Myxococcales bacterium]|nr:prepilin peptidase [Myxococcales bacterium]